MNTPLRIEMLGGLQVRVEDKHIARFRTHQTGALLAYLACHPRNEHSREVLIDILWPDADTETLHAVLETYLELVQAGELVPRAHPVFGDIGVDGWANLHIAHFEHHLKQFGV